MSVLGAARAVHLVAVLVAMVCLGLPSACSYADPAAPRLNLLLITADDLGGESVGWMGDAQGATPTLDALAGTAHRFVNLHVTAPICQPSRSALMTGLVPHRSGALGFDPVNPGTLTLPGLLRARGYYTAVMNKRRHMTPDAAFPWDMKFGRSGKAPALWASQMAQAMQAATDAKKPFFINANIVDPHRPFPGGGGNQAGRKDATAVPSEKVYAASDVAVPSFLEDLPAVREEIAQYYSAVARMDQSLASILGALDAAGHADDTIVVFLGDNGMSFPFAKGTVFRNGTHEPLLLRWPGMGQPQRREDFVSGVDLLPTLLELLGVPAPTGLDGRSWLPLLRGGKQASRDFVITYVNSVLSGESFPQRCIRTRDFSLMFHAWPDGTPRFRIDAMGGRSFNALVAAAKGNPRIAARVAQFQTGAPLMFFDLRVDPDERTNLIHEKSYRVDIDRLAKLLLAEMEKTADPQMSGFEQAMDRYRTGTKGYGSSR